MIVHIKLNIMTKFGEKINTGTMIKFGLNLSAFLVSIFREISIIQTHKNARLELLVRSHVITCMHTRYTHFRVTYTRFTSRSASQIRVLLAQSLSLLLPLCSLFFVFQQQAEKRPDTSKRRKNGPLASSYVQQAFK